MDVQGISSGVAQSSGPRKSATLGYDSFLQLLVAQLRNQDPTNPTDGAQFLAQTASFSAVEQSVQMNSKLDALLNLSLLDQAGGMIGRFGASADGLTSGVIRRVSIDGHALLAELEGGQSLVIGNGVRIS